MSIETAKGMNPLIGKIGEVYAGSDMKFTVRVVDVRQRWGRTDVLVEPVAGSGRAWKAEDSIADMRDDVEHARHTRVLTGDSTSDPIVLHTDARSRPVQLGQDGTFYWGDSGATLTQDECDELGLDTRG
jgi:hypothetical protein